MFLYELPTLFHSRHALEWTVLSPEFLLLKTFHFFLNLIQG